MTFVVSKMENRHTMLYKFVCMLTIFALLDNPIPGHCREPFFFDFGPKQGYIMPNFHKITPSSNYSPQIGFGWISPSPPQNSAGFHKTRKCRGSKNDPDSLTSDFIRTKKSVFRVDLPPGRYWITVWVGTIGGGQYIPKQDYRITANNKVVLEKIIHKENFFSDYYFKNKDWEFTSQTDVFEELIKSRLPEHTFSVETNTGELSLQVLGIPWLACVILPDFPESKRNSIIKTINQNRKKEFYDNVFKLNWRVDESKPYPISKKDRDLGYILFNRNIMRPIFPHTKPSSDEIQSKKFKIDTAGGDTGVISIGLFPTADLEDAHLELVGDIVNGKNILPSTNIRLSRVAYGVDGNRNKGLDKCYVTPWILKPANKPIFISSGWTIRYLLSVNIPKGTPHGVYKGALRFSAKNKKSSTLAFSVKVLPFDLLDGESYGRGFFYHLPRWYTSYYFPGMDSQFWKTVERDLKLMKEYGFNSLDIRHAVQIDRVGKKKVQIDFSKLRHFFDLYNQVGLKGYVLCSEGVVGTRSLIGKSPFGLPYHLPFKKKSQKIQLINIIQQIKDEYRHDKINGHLYFWATDELGGHSKVNIELGRELLKIYKSVEGVRTFSTINTREELALLPFLDMIAPNLAVDINQDIIDQIHDANIKLAFYNIGGTRYEFGYFIWRAKASLYLQWHWNNPKQDPFILIDGYRHEDSYAYQTQDHIYPTYLLEEARLGVNDYKYIYTLDKMIDNLKLPARLNKRQKAVYSDAKRTLSEIHQLCYVDISKQRKKKEKLWKSDDYQKSRDKIITAIMNLIQEKMYISN